MAVLRGMAIILLAVWKRYVHNNFTEMDLGEMDLGECDLGDGGELCKENAKGCRLITLDDMY